MPFYIIDARDLSNVEVKEDTAVVAAVYQPCYVLLSNKNTTNEVISLLQGLGNVTVLTSQYSIKEISFFIALIKEQYDLYCLCAFTGKYLMGFTYSEFFSILNGHYSTENYISNHQRIIQSVKRNKFPAKIEYVLIRFLNSIKSAVSLDVKYFIKDGFHLSEQIWSRVDETDLEMLLFCDYELALKEYGKHSAAIDYLTSGFFDEKISKLKSYYNMRANNAVDLNLIENFPVPYKFLSASYLFSSKLKLSHNAISSSFMYAFRSLETYCDGVLINSGIAEIGDVYRKGEIFKKDTLLVNGRFVPGFGSKWKLIKELDVVDSIDADVINKLDVILKLRNNFVLTHGNVKIDNDIALETINIVSEFILQLDFGLGQKVTKWKDITKSIHEFSKINLINETRKVFIDYHIVDDLFS